MGGQRLDHIMGQMYCTMYSVHCVLCTLRMCILWYKKTGSLAKQTGCLVKQTGPSAKKTGFFSQKDSAILPKRLDFQPKRLGKFCQKDWIFSQIAGDSAKQLMHLFVPKKYFSYLKWQFFRKKPKTRFFSKNYLKVHFYPKYT